jgi:hypothetical protein
LLLIAALIIFALWLIGLGLKGSVIERQTKSAAIAIARPIQSFFLPHRLSIGGI